VDDARVVALSRLQEDLAHVDADAHFDPRRSRPRRQARLQLQGKAHRVGGADKDNEERVPGRADLLGVAKGREPRAHQLLLLLDQRGPRNVAQRLLGAGGAHHIGKHEGEHTGAVAPAELFDTTAMFRGEGDPGVHGHRHGRNPPLRSQSERERDTRQ